MQNQVTEVFNQVTSVTYFFVYKISKPFWVDCLQMRNDLPVTGLVLLMVSHILLSLNPHRHTVLESV